MSSLTVLYSSLMHILQAQGVMITGMTIAAGMGRLRPLYTTASYVTETELMGLHGYRLGDMDARQRIYDYNGLQFCLLSDTDGILCFLDISGAEHLLVSYTDTALIALTHATTTAPFLVQAVFRAFRPDIYAACERELATDVSTG
ncbi:hypothetical protein GMRT_21162 [Giardia muris]|uniref:Uncharacterized protein n=1 Tax=Giardia muris TaxID=5742 RepID=A0A4Z1T897_GIAMU|nr:hypothetical protein GMRT_21162 [Giardia muris]|eukprot:TNJ30333.1 hypothetical protein GMRT_21162 [Giardia muris]